MTTLSGPEISDALGDCEPGEKVELTVTGTVTADKGVEVESVEKEGAAEDQAEGGQEEEGEGERDVLDDSNDAAGRPQKMPHGIAILIGGKPKA